jgi:hypothetical protein
VVFAFSFLTCCVSAIECYLGVCLKRLVIFLTLALSGIYELTCKTCDKAYVGQTSRSLTARFREHTRYIKNNNPQSAYALHILENLHEYGTIDDNITLLQPVKNTTMLLPYEQLLIQNYHHKGKLILEQHRGEPNPLLQLAYNTCTATHT